ncbi:MAG: exodeoxyribonuclease III [Deltaproteobacteria bacterium]|nr:exodeoxyribonuclease III [Deltaproteobacteria bacterium]MBI3386556.1 exodeoxyribonuclease III [Deltaproteobacteria bacterium]
MKIATWNVNSLRVRLPLLIEWLATVQPDVVALQETKLVDDDFPVAEIEAAGYDAAFAGQKTYNGVAVLSRGAITDVERDVPGLDDVQRRLLAATTGGVRVINVYVPNGEHIGSDKYAYKLDWLDNLTAYAAAQLGAHPRLVLLGDFNIAPEERDVYDPKEFQGQVLFSEPERAAFRRLLASGLTDTFRLFEQADRSFSWWDYRMNAFKRNRGLRIDHVLASSALRAACVACRIDIEPRRRERPSDHTPVMAEFEG